MIQVNVLDFGFKSSIMVFFCLIILYIRHQRRELVLVQIFDRLFILERVHIDAFARHRIDQRIHHRTNSGVSERSSQLIDVHLVFCLFEIICTEVNDSISCTITSPCSFRPERDKAAAGISLLTKSSNPLSNILRIPYDYVCHTCNILSVTIYLLFNLLIDIRLVCINNHVSEQIVSTSGIH